MEMRVIGAISMSGLHLYQAPASDPPFVILREGFCYVEALLF